MTPPERAFLSAKLCLCASLLSSACGEVYGQPIVDAGPGGSGDGGAQSSFGGAPSSGGAAATGGSAMLSGGAPQGGGTPMGSGGSSEPATCPSSLFGFANVGGSGGVTGGSAGKTVRATSAEELKKFATDSAPLVIEIATTIELGENIRPASDKTLIGVGQSGALLGGGFYILSVHNVIVQNLSISMVPKDIGDAIGIQSSDHVWIDHCDLSSNRTDPHGTYDGLVDITHGSDYVTLSWNNFHDHYDASLISHSKDAAAEDVGHLKVTLHHNWFHHLSGYVPRARFGQVHLYNNFYQDVDATAIISESNAEVYVEANNFNTVLAPLVTHYQDPIDGRAHEVGNDYPNSGTAMIGTESTWLPSSSYPYGIDLAESVPSLVSKCAGVGNL